LLLRKIRRLCASADWHESQWGNYYYLNIVQPTDACIRLLDQLRAQAFYLEIARDYVDPYGQLLTTFRHHVVHRWKREPSRQVKATEYGAPRHSQSNLVYYEKYSHQLEANACHTEFRLRGVRALERIGIHRLKDLLQFDHNEFWSRKLCLRGIDRHRLASSLGCDAWGIRSILAQHYSKIGNVSIDLKQQLQAGNERDYCLPRLQLRWTGQEYKLVRKRQRKRHYYRHDSWQRIDNSDATTLMVE
jgi:hypothetical protein